ncbi:MAG: SsrA-binding protein SmpB [Candidatus Margulisiibacteriota bacterium]|nr:SsrA-binding protein SmpB [Candidatus Margulisiibacteriota bacterium]
MAKYFKVIAENRKARFDYNIIETCKAGLILEGFEVKSVRQGKVNLKDSFGKVEKEEILIYGMHISPYKTAGKQPIDPVRPRKVLLKKRELVKLIGKVSEKGLILVPLKVFFDGNWAKIELGLGVAKKKYEKRDKLRRKETEREIERAFKGKTRD